MASKVTQQKRGSKSSKSSASSSRQQVIWILSSFVVGRKQIANPYNLEPHAFSDEEEARDYAWRLAKQLFYEIYPWAVPDRESTPDFDDREIDWEGYYFNKDRDCITLGTDEEQDFWYTETWGFVKVDKVVLDEDA